MLLTSLREWLFERLEHVLCGLLLLARLTDIGTTWLATPRLRLEANPVVRKLRWPFALVTLLACLLPYYHTGLAYSALVLFLLVSAHNARGIWLARSLGEDRYAPSCRRQRRAPLPCGRRSGPRWPPSSTSCSAGCSGCSAGTRTTGLGTPREGSPCTPS